MKRTNVTSNKPAFDPNSKQEVEISFKATYKELSALRQMLHYVGGSKRGSGWTDPVQPRDVIDQFAAIIDTSVADAGMPQTAVIDINRAASHKTATIVFDTGWGPTFR